MVTLLSTRETADALGVCPKTIRRWIARGKFPPPAIGGKRWKWRRSDLERWTAENL